MSVSVDAADPLSMAGLVASLDQCPELTVLPAERRAEADIRVVAIDRLAPAAVTALRRAAMEIGTPVVLVAGELGEDELLTAVECRVVAVVIRATATGDRLCRAILAAATGGGVLPPTLLGDLLRQVERLRRDLLEPNGLTAAGLTTREVDVLRLMADGLDTAEIAQRLSYSERTVKNVFYALTQRLKLRNRSHAVAYALRAGVI